MIFIFECFQIYLFKFISNKFKNLLFLKKWTIPNRNLVTYLMEMSNLTWIICKNNHRAAWVWEMCPPHSCPSTPEPCGRSGPEVIWMPVPPPPPAAAQGKIGPEPRQHKRTNPVGGGMCELPSCEYGRTVPITYLLCGDMGWEEMLSPILPSFNPPTPINP